MLLKVIIETGELKEEALIRRASEICIDAGADFIKTSTGKVPVNATPEAARIMMEVIKAKNPKVGFACRWRERCRRCRSVPGHGRRSSATTGYPPVPSALVHPACWPVCWPLWGMATSRPTPAVTNRLMRGGRLSALLAPPCGVWARIQACVTPAMAEGMKDVFASRNYSQEAQR